VPDKVKVLEISSVREGAFTAAPELRVKDEFCTLDNIGKERLVGELPLKLLPLISPKDGKISPPPSSSKIILSPNILVSAGNNILPPLILENLTLSLPPEGMTLVSVVRPEKSIVPPLVASKSCVPAPAFPTLRVNTDDKSSFDPASFTDMIVPAR
jgi:hypothetical protein